jgi:hypothetical protein
MSYADRESARNAAYDRTYRAWVATLPAGERARLKAQGIAAPDTSRRAGCGDGDAITLARATSPEASPVESAVAALDPAERDPDELQALAQRVASDALASFAARIRAHPNPLMALDALCYAGGLMDVEGLSETELAARHGVTRAAFSKLAVQWTEIFDLPPSRGMRSRRARQTHREARLAFLAKQNEHRRSNAA